MVPFTHNEICPRFSCSGIHSPQVFGWSIAEGNGSHHAIDFLVMLCKANSKLLPPRPIRMKISTFANNKYSWTIIILKVMSMLITHRCLSRRVKDL